jgi:predicted chitinase
MPVTVTLDQILHLAPNARSSYREAFQNGQPLLDQFSISDTPLRLAHFMAQVLHESGGLANQIESLNYSAERLPKVWPSRFKPTGPLDPADFAHNQQKLGNEVYGGRMGNTGPNDGFTYRGRGLLQLTGKDSYQEATDDSARPEPRRSGFRGDAGRRFQRAMVSRRRRPPIGRRRAAMRSPMKTTSARSPKRSTADSSG